MTQEKWRPAFVISTWVLVFLLALMGGLSAGKFLKNLQNNRKSSNLSRIPNRITVKADGTISASPIPNLTEEQKKVLADGLNIIFHAQASNLAYYFEYFSIIEFGDDAQTSAFIIAFSHEPPKVEAREGKRMVNFVGQRVSFSFIIGQQYMIYTTDGFFEFNGAFDLRVRTFSSKFPSYDKAEQPSGGLIGVPRGEKF